jgi:hypothetical protein
MQLQTMPRTAALSTAHLLLSTCPHRLCLKLLLQRAVPLQGLAAWLIVYQALARLLLLPLLLLCDTVAGQPNSEVTAVAVLLLMIVDTVRHCCRVSTLGSAFV